MNWVRLFSFCLLSCGVVAAGGCAGLNGGTNGLDELVEDRIPRPFPTAVKSASKDHESFAQATSEAEPQRQVAARPVEEETSTGTGLMPLQPGETPTLEDLSSGRPLPGQMKNLPFDRVSFRPHNVAAEEVPSPSDRPPQDQIAQANGNQTPPGWNPPPAQQSLAKYQDPHAPETYSAAQQILAQMANEKHSEGLNYNSLLEAQMRQTLSHMQEAQLIPSVAPSAHPYSGPPPGEVVPAGFAQPVAPVKPAAPPTPAVGETARTSPPSTNAETTASTANAPASPAAVPAANATTPPPEPTAAELMRQIEVSRAQMIDTLERTLAKNDPSLTPEKRLRLQQELRLAYLAAERIDDATQPLDAVDDVDSESFKHLMFTLHHILPREDDRRAPHRHALALRSLRDAERELSVVSRLDLRNLTFCEAVQQFGWYSEFKRREFAAGQQVILYLEVENATAEKKSIDQYETELQGSYQIFNAANELVAERTLPLDKETCRNWRRDYFLAYRVYLPDDVGAGSYRLELRLEDLKARPVGGGKKLGEGLIDFTIR